MKNDLVKCGERVDDLQNGYFVIQDPKKFCFGMDCCAAFRFCPGKKGRDCAGYGNRHGNHSDPAFPED